MGKSNSTFMNIFGTIVGISVGMGIAAFVQERIEEKKNTIPCPHQQGLYEKYLKRPLDCTLATGASLCLSPVLAVTAVLVKEKLGSPVLFTQERPGRNGKIFKLYKFRSMTDEKDDDGNLLPDDVRLTEFGKKLRSTSLDELPELFNIIKGDMAVVGPRPLLVRYLSRYNTVPGKKT
jgi:undecaprenyl phosphate N,N'-diacetylbacillosamine 1-phosphate transferase